ncbi:MAG TPA: tetratricopeptide repeat protein, partial [Candidatus Competibacter sp.]|nr:tetratricopeptide repeat protein [Candidatus Competibacter sp.]
PLGQDIHEMHPALTGFLRARPVVEQNDGQRDAWRRAFVEVLWQLANETARKELHEQRPLFHRHSVNFHTALAEAEALGMDHHSTGLTVVLAGYAMGQRDFASADRYFAVTEDYFRQRNEPVGVAALYHQRGMIARERRNLVVAQQWTRKALEIWNKLGDEHKKAASYHLLGMIAFDQNDLPAAEQEYHNSLNSLKRMKEFDEDSAAKTYLELGNVALKQEKFEVAEDWYQKALKIKEKRSTEYDVAKVYSQLGTVALRQGKVKEAEDWYQKALAIFEKSSYEDEKATIYNQLGNFAADRALAQSDNAVAKKWYLKAKKWYLKALNIKENRSGNQHSTALTYGNLGVLEGRQNNFVESGRWLVRAIVGFTHQQDAHYAKAMVHNFLIFYRQAPPDDQIQLRQIWEEAGLGPFADGNPP